MFPIGNNGDGNEFRLESWNIGKTEREEGMTEARQAS